MIFYEVLVFETCIDLQGIILNLAQNAGRN